MTGIKSITGTIDSSYLLVRLKDSVRQHDPEAIAQQELEAKVRLAKMCATQLTSWKGDFGHSDLEERRMRLASEAFCYPADQLLLNGNQQRMREACVMVAKAYEHELNQCMYQRHELENAVQLDITNPDGQAVIKSRHESLDIGLTFKVEGNFITVKSFGFDAKTFSHEYTGKMCRHINENQNSKPTTKDMLSSRSVCEVMEAARNAANGLQNHVVGTIQDTDNNNMRSIYRAKLDDNSVSHNHSGAVRAK